MAKNNKSSSSSSSGVKATGVTRNTGNAKNGTGTISLSNGSSIGYTTVGGKTSYTSGGKTYSSLAGAMSGTGGVSTPSKGGTYKYNSNTGYYERTDGGKDIYGHTVVGGGTVSNLKDYSSNSYGGNNYNNNVASSMSNMKFGNAAAGTDLNSRNSQIADIMKKNGIKATDATNVKEFLEMYAPGYKEASDEDKNNTANKIFGLYSPASNDDTLNMGENLDSSNTDNTDYATIDGLLEEEGIVGQDNNSENNGQNDAEEYDERDEYIKRLEEENLALKEKEANYMEDSLNNLSQNNQTEEKKGLSDAEKEANTAASAAAWNAAQGGNNAEAEATTTEQPVTQPVVNSENYGDRQTKIMNILGNLGYNIDTAPSEQAENAEISNAIEGGEPVEGAEEQAAIAESNATNGEETPTYTDEPSLVTSYQKAFDNLLQQGPSPETAKEAIKTYLQAKDAAALFTVQNNLSDEAYQNILNQIKSVPSLKDLLKNYNK